MTNIGDKVKLKKYDETIYTVVNVEDEHVRVINGTGTQLMQVRKDFIDVVEQYIDYKQRADELEKQWSELKKILLLYKNVPQRTQSFDTVFELMKEIESKKEDE